MLDEKAIRSGLASGTLPRSAVEDAARLGYAPARQALDGKAPPLLTLDLQTLQFWAPSRSWRPWKTLVGHLGPMATADAVAAVAERALVGCGERPEGPSLTASVRLFREWTRCPCKAHEDKIEMARRELRKRFDSLPEGSPEWKRGWPTANFVVTALEFPKNRSRRFEGSLRHLLWIAYLNVKIAPEDLLVLLRDAFVPRLLER